MRNVWGCSGAPRRPRFVVQLDSWPRSRPLIMTTFYPVALHGAGRTADEADDTIGSAAAARTRQLTRYNDLMPFECTVKAQASSDHDSFR